MGVGNDQPTGEVAVRVTGVLPRFRPLLRVGPPRSLGSSKLPGPSGIQLQVGDVLLDPGLAGVGTDLPASFGLEDDTRLGALAAGLKIVVYEFAWNLPGYIGEAAGGRGVSTNCRGRDRVSLSHSSEGKERSEISFLRGEENSLAQGVGWETRSLEGIGISA